MASLIQKDIDRSRRSDRVAFRHRVLGEARISPVFGSIIIVG